MSTLLLLLGHGGEGAGWQLPPLHPLLVNFTAALIPTSVVSDWVGRFSRRESLQAAAWWTMLYAAVITPFTAAAGWWWRVGGDHPADSAMLWHQWLGTSMAVAAVALGFWRWRLRRQARPPGAAYLAAATLAVAALAVQADIGARMSFGAAGPGGTDHGHAVAGSPEAPPRIEAPRRTERLHPNGIPEERGEDPNTEQAHPPERFDGGGKPAATGHTHGHR